jgi:hypothetical protein
MASLQKASRQLHPCSRQVLPHLSTCDLFSQRSSKKNNFGGPILVA